MNAMKNIILLKNLPSNLVEEAIVVLKENAHIQKSQIKELEENNRKINDESVKKSEKKSIKRNNNTNYNSNVEYKKSNEGSKTKNNDYIIKEAEMLIKSYIENLEMKTPRWKNNMKKLEKRYKNSVKLNFILSFTTLIGLIFIII